MIAEWSSQADIIYKDNKLRLSGDMFISGAVD